MSAEAEAQQRKVPPVEGQPVGEPTFNPPGISIAELVAKPTSPNLKNSLTDPRLNGMLVAASIGNDGTPAREASVGKPERAVQGEEPPQEPATERRGIKGPPPVEPPTGTLAMPEPEEPEFRRGSERTDYDDISETAILAVGMRALTGVQYAQELYNAAVALHPTTPYPPEEIATKTYNAPDIEAFEVVTHDVIQEVGNPQVMGIFGISTMWADDPDRTYVDFDLPGMSRFKQDVMAMVPAVNEIIEGRPNLHFAPGNALDEGALLRAARQHLTPGVPVTFVTSGLLHYLNLEEREILARNVGELLDWAGEGSVWLTDMPSKEGIKNVDRSISIPTSAQTGRDIAGMRFEDNAQASEFFANLGLPEVQPRRPYISVLDQLQVPERLNLSRDAVGEKISPWSLWLLGRPEAPVGESHSDHEHKHHS